MSGINVGTGIFKNYIDGKIAEINEGIAASIEAEPEWFTAVGASEEVFTVANAIVSITEVSVSGLEQEPTTHYINTPPSKDVALTYKPAAGAKICIKYKYDSD